MKWLTLIKITSPDQKSSLEAKNDPVYLADISIMSILPQEETENSRNGNLH